MGSTSTGAGQWDEVGEVTIVLGNASELQFGSMIASPSRSVHHGHLLQTITNASHPPHSRPKLDRRARSPLLPPTLTLLPSCRNRRTRRTLFVQHSWTTTSPLLRRFLWSLARSPASNKSGGIVMRCSHVKGTNFGHDYGPVGSLPGSNLELIQ